MPLQATSGAASYDAFGGGVAAVPNYIEDVFSTWLYTGNGSTQTINNGIDLAGKGGLVWTKSRSLANNNDLEDTVRGVTKSLFSNLTNAEFTNTPAISSFSSTGYTIGGNGGVSGNYNTSGETYASWTFRKQPKFFDVVTYTGNGTGGRAISHALGSVPGCIIVKRTDTTGNWAVYHRSTGNTGGLRLNATDAFVAYGSYWFNTTPTATEFTVGNNTDVNASGGTYVAYLFAHNAGGFGLTGTDNVISCGSFTTDGSGNATVNLGYEPQWVLIKASSTSGSWRLMDNMRGMPVTANSSTATGGRLYPNFANADDGFPSVIANATGFVTVPGTVGNSETSIYIAIRRGPMKTPTTGTSVFGLYRATSATSPSLVSSFPVDMLFTKNPSSSGYTPFISSRLTSETRMNTGSTAAEATDSTFDFDYQNGALSVDITDYLGWMFRRAPGFFDEVCYTGTGSATTVAHNLGVAPEMIIVKRRNGGGSESWVVQHSGLTGGIGQGANSDYIVYLDSTNAEYDSDGTFNFSPTSATFSLQNNSNSQVNASGGTYVAYLFASCPGVSKVGSYTGTGTTQTINCGFTAGSRFVLIKRTDSTGDWYVWDSARGIVAGNDPYLLLNSTAAEVTNTDYVDTATTGFEISSTAPAAINASGGTFIFLAIA